MRPVQMTSTPPASTRPSVVATCRLRWRPTDPSISLCGTTRFEIYGQRLTGSGAEVGSNDFRLSDAEPSPVPFHTTLNPRVAYNPVSGQWLVAWEGTDQVGGTLVEGIFAQHLAPGGGEIGTDDFLVSASGYSSNPALASSLTSDDFLFTWKVGDVAGARRVQSTNCTLTQTCQGPATPSGNPPGLPALRAIKASLKRSLGTAVDALKRLGLDGLPGRRRFVIGDFRALTAGKVAVSLTARPGPRAGAARAVVVARGRRAIPAAGRYRVSVRLTKQGRRKLAGLAVPGCAWRSAFVIAAAASPRPRGHLSCAADCPPRGSYEVCATREPDLTWIRAASFPCIWPARPR